MTAQRFHQMPKVRAALAALVLLIAAVLVWRLGAPGHHHTPPPTSIACATTPNRGVPGEPMMFAPSSVWNTPVSPCAAVDPSSAQLIHQLTADVSAEEASGIGPWLATSHASMPIYMVPAGQPVVRVALDYPNLAWRRTLQRAFAAVPIPPRAAAAIGHDAQMVVWQPSTNKMWEFFHMRREADGWHADWGGAMDDVSESPGYYTAASWPGASYKWGASATSLPIGAGVITLKEIRAGVIDHAVAIDLPRTRSRAVSWPAEQGDGSGGPDAIPEGAHLRLDPHLDLAKLSLPPLVRMIAVAAQRYGMIVRDSGPAIILFTEDPTQYYGKKGPFWGRHGLFGGLTPQQLLARFPWADLQVLELHMKSVPLAAKFTKHSQL